MKTSTVLTLLALLLFGANLDAQGYHDHLLGAEDLKLKRTYRSLEAALKNPTDVYKLSLIDQDLKELPAEIGQLKNLQVLYLNYNKLKELPEEFGELKHLQVLNLYKNKLRELPEFFKNFKHLEELYMGQNKVQTAPLWIAHLRKNLRLLDLSFNPVFFSEQAYFKDQLPHTAMSF